MKRLTLLVVCVACCALAAHAQTKSLIKINLQAGKSMEGGIAINPVTHKAYIIAEKATEDADDQKAVFVISNSVLNAKSAPKKLNLPLGTTTHAPTVVPIPYENEYIAIDSTRNLIYVPTKFSVEQDESDSGGGSDPGEAPGGLDMPALAPVTSLTPEKVTLGTLTVIDGNTDTVIATWYFKLGIEPEGVAVDPTTGVVYVGAKAPEGEASDDDYCSSGHPIYDVGEPGDVECWTAGHIYAFLVDRATTPKITYLKAIRAGDDPESVVFQNGKVYAANEDDGTVTIARKLRWDSVLQRWVGGGLLTDKSTWPTNPGGTTAPYSLGVFYTPGFDVSGPNPLACLENQYEADKMAAGGSSVFITDDRSRVAKITGTAVVNMVDVIGATICEYIPNTDGGGLNSANNIAFMQRSDHQLLYVVSEQDTVAILDPLTMAIKTTIAVPGASHLDGIAVDPAANRVWLTDEDLQAVFVLQGACANGTGACIQ